MVTAVATPGSLAKAEKTAASPTAWLTGRLATNTSKRVPPKRRPCTTGTGAYSILYCGLPLRPGFASTTAIPAGIVPTACPPKPLVMAQTIASLTFAFTTVAASTAAIWGAVT